MRLALVASPQGLVVRDDALERALELGRVDAEEAERVLEPLHLARMTALVPKTTGLVAPSVIHASTPALVTSKL